MDANSTKLFRVKADSAFDSQAISRALPTRFNAYEVQKAHSQHALHAHRKANATNSALNSKVFLGISHTHKATSQAFANLNSNSAESRLTNWGGGGDSLKSRLNSRFYAFSHFASFARFAELVKNLTLNPRSFFSPVFFVLVDTSPAFSMMINSSLHHLRKQVVAIYKIIDKLNSMNCRARAIHSLAMTARTRIFAHTHFVILSKAKYLNKTNLTRFFAQNSTHFIFLTQIPTIFAQLALKKDFKC